MPGYSQSQLETALRKAALKSKSSLDNVGSSTDAGTKYAFLGYEGKSGLTFTRIKYFIEKYLPKLIIRLAPGTNEASYQIRFSLLSSIVIAGLALLTLLMLLALVAHPENITNALPLIVLIAIYTGLILLEIKLTTKKVSKVLKQYTESDLAG